MLVDGLCSIYEHRPRACRTYDCRVFAATGIAVDPGKPLLAQRVAQWTFATPTEVDEALDVALHRAAAYLRKHADDLARAGSDLPMDPTQIAVLTIEIHGLFIEGVDDPDLAQVCDALQQAKTPEAESPQPTDDALYEAVPEGTRQ
jgi:Fe-S-cluster containining protein